MASKGLRIAARVLDYIGEGMLVVATLMVLGDKHRPWTDLFLMIASVALYEAGTTAWLGGTLGKRLVGLRVVAVDARGRPSLSAALRRGAVCALLSVLVSAGFLVGLGLLALSTSSPTDGSSGTKVSPGAALLVIGFSLLALAVWAVSTFGDPLGRGFADRAGTTMVVPNRFVGTVTQRDLPGYADAARPPRLTHLGRVADPDVRARARLRRIYGSRFLAGAIGLLALAVSLRFTTSEIVLASSAIWIMAFVYNETRLVHRQATTPGHLMAGLVIVDRRRGGPPSTPRSFARALVLGLTLYVPILWPLLGASLLLMRFQRAGRGLHDFAGGTVVVSDQRLDPELQRQRTMRMRLGQAG